MGGRGREEREGRGEGKEERRTTDCQRPINVGPPSPMRPTVADQDQERDSEEELQYAGEVEEFRVGE